MLLFCVSLDLHYLCTLKTKMYDVLQQASEVRLCIYIKVNIFIQWHKKMFLRK